MILLMQKCRSTTILNQFNDGISQKNKNTFLKLEITDARPNFRVIKFLVDRGVNVNFGHHCLIAENLSLSNDITKLLISSGINIDRRLKDSGNSALDEIIAECWCDIWRKKLDAKTNASSMDCVINQIKNINY